MYREVKNLQLTDVDKEIMQFWHENKIFEKSVSGRNDAPTFVFYEGPPSANGKPGIHHVMSRTVKDLFCRYQTLLGKKVERKGGWDTHGLPIELSVEKELGITKEDIGIKISVQEYNRKCKETVMRFKNEWDDLTRKMGYWVDLDHPYMTFESAYIESVWFLLKEIYKKGFLYKGYSIQPYSPAAGTGLSSHELNQPGTYKEVKDTSCVAMFKAIKNDLSEFLFEQTFGEELFFLAWTTTPWTLPSNLGLTVGPDINYVLVRTFNPYTYKPCVLILAKNLVSQYFKSEGDIISFSNYKEGDKIIPWKIVFECKGNQLEGITYEQLLAFDANTKEIIQSITPGAEPFKIVCGDFVTTEDGTGIVHTAPAFGADDFRIGKKYNLGILILVDREGKFLDGLGEFSHRYVKNYKDEAHYTDVNIDICVKLKKENRAFKVEKYVHSYPHCWRTDKPILYYPLDSWFIKVTAIKDRLVELNNTIKWKPASTGTGRFGNWLENLQDWNLSRSRYWGIPLPVWRNAEGSKEICIGSIEELKEEIIRANKIFGLQQSLPEDLHRPFIDEITLASEDGHDQLKRELDLIDVWFDSGAMPYAQHHFPFSGIALDKKIFPADFIAEGVDQTRGWFYTLHAIAGLVFDSVAYKTVVSNGLVLDKNGEKMSKRKGNVVDPFLTLNTYGADTTRWYLMSNADPWENLKFDLEGITEVRNKFFGTLINTYNFFAIYANIDKFSLDRSKEISYQNRPELDRWILSKLQSVVKLYRTYMDDYEPTQATRLVENFVSNNLSNWHVRLSRRRFWKSDSSIEKQSAFETLFECLVVSSQLIAPFAPFFADWLYKNLTGGINLSIPEGSEYEMSVHLSQLPHAKEDYIDEALERRMDYAQRISSLILSLRKAQKIRVRQPLQKILIPVLDPEFQKDIEKVASLIKAEVNIKDILYISDDSGIIKKKTKPNFRTLGKKLGKNMQEGASVIQNFGIDQIQKIELGEAVEINLADQMYFISAEDVEIISEDIPGWLVSSDGTLTVALDIQLDEQLEAEGVARELINRIQNIRKAKDFNVTDKIKIVLEKNQAIDKAIILHKDLICSEVLGVTLDISSQPFHEQMELFEDVNIGYDIRTE
ncbi:MAG: isoleucine--tRNA ligase [Bacteroidota bacterium]|nr:isoleucine--tRNA ligase [Bacteroidota bacterium]